MKLPRLRPGLVTDSWELKLTALGLAVLLWAAVRSEESTRFTMDDVPVDVRLTDDGWVAHGPTEPQRVTVDVRGPVRELIRLQLGRATLVVPVEDVEDTVELYRTRPEWIEFDRRFENLLVEDIRPAVLRVRFQPIERRMVPVSVRLPDGIETAARAVIEPARVMVEGPRNLLRALDSVVVHVPDLEAALDGRVALTLDTTGIGVFVRPASVNVHFEPVVEDAPTPDGASRR